jgi:hypothetical protein
MGTASPPGVKQPGPGFNHPPPSSAEIKEMVELYIYPTPLWGFTAFTSFSATLRNMGYVDFIVR